MNSFIENVNYVAGLDNLYGSGIELYKNNLSLKSVQYDIELKFSYYDDDDKKIHSIVHSEPGVLFGGIEDMLLSFKTLVESSITGSEFTCTVSSGVQNFVINNIVMVNISIVSNSDMYKTYELEMKVVTDCVVTYDVFGEVKDSLKILPSLAMITASDIDAIVNVYEIKADISTISGSLDTIETVSDSIANVNTVGISISNVNIVGEDIANVSTVSTHISNVDIAATNIANIEIVATSIDNVTVASANISNINTVANAQNLADIIKVADDLNSLDVNGIADITIVANDLVLGVDSNIITVSESIDNVNITGDNIGNVNTVGINITDIGTVSTNIANVNITATDISSVNNVSLNIADVNTVSDGITNVNIVSGSISNVNTVATNIVGLNSIVSNMTEILLADDNAAIATIKALESSHSAESSLQSETDAAASALSALISSNSASSYASNAANSAASALSSKDSATASAISAGMSASTATTKASEASMSATNAASSATASATSVSSASTSATSASASADTATTKASEASTSATNAAAYEASALTSATTATTKATNASESATAAASSATNATASATTATTQATIATTQAGIATTGASTATTKADEAATSATTAATFATNAAVSETSAGTSASTATTKASEASVSATSAATSATNASISATESSTSAWQSATSASSAASSATDANTSKLAAAVSAGAASASAVSANQSALDAIEALDEFTDIYLGRNITAPTVDNDGNALVEGTIYWNTTSKSLFIYNGTWWDPAVFDASGAVTSFNGRDGVVTLINTDVTGATGQDLSVVGTPSFASVKVTGGTGLTAGVMSWNSYESTVDLVLENGVTLQVGQENNRLVRNYTGVTITNGRLCMFAGTIGNSGRVKVKHFTGLFSEHSLVYGIATQDITSGSDGYITTNGKVREIDTTGAPYGEVWADEDVIYAKPNDNGALTNIEPGDDQLKMIVATVIHAHTNGTLEIRVLPFNENMIAKRANKLTTARDIEISGVITGYASFDGSGDINIATSIGSVDFGEI